MHSTIVAAVSGSLLLAMTAAPSEAQVVRWHGHFTIVSKSGTCPIYDPVGDHGFVRFRPQLAGTDNGPGTRLAVYRDRNLTAFRLASGLFSENLKVVEETYAADAAYVDNANPVRVRFLSQTPRKINANTPFINVVGQIDNYDLMSECRVTFHMALTKEIR
jgi:hypothetical protein